MKKIYMIGLAACTAMSVCAASPVKLPKKPVRQAAKERKVTVKADNGVWCAGTSILSSWDEETCQWVENSEYKTTYDGRGNILQDVITEVEDGERERITYTYNENDMQTSETTEVAEANADFVNYQQKTRKYDPVVKSLVVENRDYMWMNNSWSQPGNCWNRNVTRDANGVITEVEIATLYQGVYDPTKRQKNVVGADGKISGFTTTELTYDGGEFVWEDDMTCSDMVWDVTDGQIYDEDSFVSGANKVKSFTLTDHDPLDGDLTSNATVEYNENGFVMTAKTLMDGIVLTATNKFEEKPNNGYLTEYTESVAYDGNTEAVVYEEEYAYYDAYGLELETGYKEGTTKEDAELFEQVVGTVDYDPTYGYPVTYTRAYLDAETGEMINDVKIVFSDYHKTSGIDGIVEDTDAPVEYYTIDGVKTDASAPGLYIRRQGNKVTKILK